MALRIKLWEVEVTLHERNDVIDAITGHCDGERAQALREIGRFLEMYGFHGRGRIEGTARLMKLLEKQEYFAKSEGHLVESVQTYLKSDHGVDFVRSYLEPIRNDGTTAATGEARPVNPPKSYPGVECEEPEILPDICDDMPVRRRQPRAPTAGGSSLGARKSRTVDETVRCKAEDEFRPEPLKKARTDTTDVLTAGTVKDFRASLLLKGWLKWPLFQGSMNDSDEGVE